MAATFIFNQSEAHTPTISPCRGAARRWGGAFGLIPPWERRTNGIGAACGENCNEPSRASLRDTLPGDGHRFAVRWENSGGFRPRRNSLNQPGQRGTGCASYDPQTVNDRLPDQGIFGACQRRRRPNSLRGENETALRRACHPRDVQNTGGENL